MIVYRAWINQPSTLQPLHEHHGRRCIVVEGAYGITAYFTHGKVYSLQVLPEFITKIKLSDAKGGKRIAWEMTV